MQVGCLVRYISTGEVGIILDKEYGCYDDDSYKVYWFSDSCFDWWDGSELEVISESR